MDVIDGCSTLGKVSHIAAIGLALGRLLRKGAAAGSVQTRPAAPWQLEAPPPFGAPASPALFHLQTHPTTTPQITPPLPMFSPI